MIDILFTVIKSFIKREEFWLFTDWDLDDSGFIIYTSYKDMRMITGRSLITSLVIPTRRSFCINDIESEILEFASLHKIKICGLKETLKGLEEYGYYR